MELAATFVLNGKCNGPNVEAAQASIVRIAAEHGVRANVLVARRPGDLETFVKQGRAESPVVAAGGGDGTISTAAAQLVDSQAILGVLPMGTLNHFAKDLAVPLDLEAAIRTVFTGETRAVDVAEVNGRVFINNSSIGLYPRIVREREEHQRHGYRKWGAAAWAAAHVLWQGGTLHLELATADGATAAQDTPLLFVGNNRYAIDARAIGTRAALDRGTLWVCAAPPAVGLRQLGRAVGSFLGLGAAADLVASETPDLRVRLRRHRVDVATDGEVTVMRAPLHYRIRPAALRVRVPAA